MKNKLIVIKLGGSCLQDEGILDTVTEGLSKYYDEGYQLIIVHGGGPLINEELKNKNISWEFVDGQRITSPVMMKSIEMVLKGFINGKIVRALNQKNISSIGLSGGENQILLCEPLDPRFERVGHIVSVNNNFLNFILSHQVLTVPVIAPLGVGRDGQTYNINADFAAAQIAISLKASQLIYLTDQDGIWDSSQNIIEQVTRSGLSDLIKNKIVVGGMLPKVQTIMKALDHGVSDVHVLHAKELLKLFSGYSVGTKCLRGEP